MKKETRQAFRDFGYYSSIGLQVAFSVIIGFFIGSYLDKRFQTEPYLTYVFLVFGIAAGFRNILLAIKKIQRSEAKDKP